VAQHRTERVMIETERYRVTGTLHLPREGYRSRLSDFLSAADRDFVSLTDVAVEPLDGRAAPVTHRYLAVARRHIVLAAPMDPDSQWLEPAPEG
jgi:hypothetical protein